MNVPEGLLKNMPGQCHKIERKIILTPKYTKYTKINNFKCIIIISCISLVVKSLLLKKHLILAFFINEPLNQLNKFVTSFKKCHYFHPV